MLSGGSNSAAPGMQAEDHLGRLPPSWLTLAGSLPAGLDRRQAIG